MSFVNARDVEKWVNLLDKRISEDIELRDEMRKFLKKPEPSTPASRSEGIPEGAWRTHPASEKQIATLEKFKVNYRDGITKGEAADIIQDLFARRDK